MKPSFSPTRVTIDADSGRPRFHDDGDVVLRALSLSPGASRRPFDATPAPSSCSSLQLLLQGVVHAVLAGVVVSIVLCPVMIGFATMIFSHPDFSETLPMLTKLVFASSTMHQLVITSLSPLPFAIGQVQDTGMIFLASMASSIMTELGSTVPLVERIATVLVHLSISTMLVGVGLILTGKAKLASLVQYLPTPVIGGYLAYVGFFMVKGGVSLTTGVSLASVHGWAVLMSSSHSLTLLAPGLIGGIMLSILTSRFLHFAVFPCCILILPASFFFVVWISSYTLDDARAAGFLEDNGAGVPVMEVYELFDLNHIHWRVMPAQLPTMLSMFVMIAFASSLDIASICMGTTSSMNYNAQLQTVGMSNLVSGLTGGYTGSYIFSQTLFTSRFRPSAAAESRFPGITKLVGVTLAACEFAIVTTPVSLMAIVPKFLFGAVMIFIGIDLLKTWLVGVFHKLLFAEYLTVVATSFLVEYAKVQDVRIVHKTSNAIRNADQHALLYGANSMSGDAESRQQDAIVTIELQGHIFFGSATRIQNCVKSAVYLSFSLGKVCAVYCGMRPSVEFLLRANDVIPPAPTQGEELVQDESKQRECYVASDLDLALDWCEQQLIFSAAKRRSIRSGQHLALSSLQSPALPLPQVFAAYLSGTRKGDPATLQHLEELAQLFTVAEWEAQRKLFLVGERSNAWFVLLRGTVELLTVPTETTLPSYSPKSELAEPIRLQHSTQRELVGHVRPGCIFGDMDFMLEQPRVLDATSTATDTLTASFTRKKMVELRQGHPELALLLHEILLRASYMTLAEKLHSLAI
ncbi:hypothetical protein PI125_g16313 [Phytophthora idaei]|nr:hypothetical protein PI125_g16313 [Phytophthora idaei]